MIVVDIETSGVDFERSGIFQIGAIDFDNFQRQFFQEAKIDSADIVFEKGKRKLFEIIGKTEEQLRDKNKQGQKEMLKNFFKWCGETKIKNFMCMHPQFDVSFLEIRARRYGLEFPFSYKALDLHSLAACKYLKLTGKYLIKDKKSDMGLKNVAKFCGIKDERGFHNALEDAKLEAECFSRILNGENLIEDYKNIPVPGYLKEIK